MKIITQKHRSLASVVYGIAFIGAFFTAPAQAATYFFHNDHLGTPQVVTDSNQEVAWEVDQEPFGEGAITTNKVVQNIRFPGQYFDSETNTSYNYFRMYDASIGRYTQSDPIGLDGGLNTYGYVYQNPLTYTDPTGEFGIFGSLLGAGVDISIQLATNGGNWQCIDWADVGVSALVGFFAPGLGSAGKYVYTSAKASKKLSQQLNNARTENKISKLKSRINSHKSKIIDEIVVQAVWQGTKQAGKNVAGRNNESCECGF